MKPFLFLAKKANLEGKLAGAFGAYTQSGESMQYLFKMEPFEMGSFKVKEAHIDTRRVSVTCQGLWQDFR